MIEGLKITISSDELKQHLDSRVKYHEEKWNFYGKQAQGLAAGREPGMGVMSNDPVHSLDTSAKSHQDRASFFRFVSDCLIPNETYQLDESDLSRLEIASRYYG